MNENKMGNTLHAFIKSTLIKSLQKCHIQNYHPTSLRKRIGGWEVCLKITLLNLRQNWVIRIEKGGPNNSAQVIAILGNLYCKHCLLKKHIN